MRYKSELNFAMRWEQVNADPALVRSRKRTKRAVLGIAVFIAVFLIGSSPWLWGYVIDMQILNLSSKIAVFKDIDGQVQHLNALKAKDAAQTELLTITRTNTKDPGPLLEKLRNLLPAGTTIGTFNLQADNSLILTINTLGPIDTARLWVSLQDSKLFQKIDLSNISLQDKLETITFNLKLK